MQDEYNNLYWIGEFKKLSIQGSSAEINLILYIGNGYEVYNSHENIKFTKTADSWQSNLASQLKTC